MPDIDISFKGSTIASISDSGVTVLNTEGKYCEDNITVTYTKPSGGSSTPSATVEEKDVNFIDYDGTLLYSYTASDFANLTAMPTNPSHTGLTAQGWNWALADAKTYVASYGKLVVGQMYVTQSGDTEIDIELHAPRLTPYLGIAVNGSVDVDWGDGSTHDTMTGTSLTSQKLTAHTYASEGLYKIKIHVSSGSFAVHGNGLNAIISGGFSNVNRNKVYANSVKSVRIGTNVTLGIKGFIQCSSLESINIPSGMQSIGNENFNGCSSLTSITFPSGITNIGDSMFRYCSSFKSLSVPSGVTSIGYAAFQNCQLSKLISIPSNVTRISGYTFTSSSCLSSISIPNNVTSIDGNAFDSCKSLASIIIPGSVTSIASKAFNSCSGLGEIYFIPTTPPGVLNSDAFSDLPTDCIIYIPGDTAAIMAAYAGGTNYPSLSSYKYIGYATFASGATLPTYYGSSYTFNWYATKEEAIADNGTILSSGTGNEIYCRVLEGMVVTGDD